MSTSMSVTSGMMPELESAMLSTRLCGAVCLEAIEKKENCMSVCWRVEFIVWAVL